MMISRRASQARWMAGAAWMTVLLPAAHSLEVNAADAFFDVKHAETHEYGHARNTMQWAERCFSDCLSDCAADPPERSTSLRLLQWSQSEDCAYRCLHACVGEGMRNGGKMYKYKGKWPHTRLLGAQEPFASAFSLLNVAAHFAGGMLLMRAKAAAAAKGALPADLAGHIARLQTMSFLWCVAWVCSALFHVRDTWLTERADYFSGNAAMTYMVFTALVRVGWTGGGLHRGWLRAALGAGLAAGIGAHMAGNYDGIDYTRNMVVMISLLTAHTGAWAWRCQHMSCARTLLEPRLQTLWHSCACTLHPLSSLHTCACASMRERQPDICPPLLHMQQMRASVRRRVHMRDVRLVQSRVNACRCCV